MKHVTKINFIGFLLPFPHAATGTFEMTYAACIAFLLDRDALEGENIFSPGEAGNHSLFTKNSWSRRS